MQSNQFSAFSKKQLAVLSWWHPSSVHHAKDGIIADGAVRSGKTFSMSLSFVLWACTNFSDSSFAICGKTITSVKRNIGVGLLSTLRSLGFCVTEKISQNMFTVSVSGRSNRFYFFGGRDEASASLIQGMTLSGILLDEVALMPKSFVSQALARCSVEGAKFWFNCNPDNPSHWFYTEWICQKDAKNVLYLHFTMKDNPSLSQGVIARYESLYSGTFYDRFILGKWVATSGLVYPEAANGAYTKEPEGTASRYIVSVDYGTVNPFSAGLWGLFGNCWYRVDEYYYSSRRQGAQKTDEEYYTELKHLIGDRDAEQIIVDPSAASFIETIRRHAEYQPVKAKNNVAFGIHKTHEALRSGRIFISRKCVDCLKEFSLYRWEESGAKDSVVKENDHAMDDMRYFVATVLCRSDDEPIFFGNVRSA